MNALDKHAYLFFSIGLFLVFMAHALWAYYIIIGTNPSGVSYADFFWLASYTFFFTGAIKLISAYSVKINQTNMITILFILLAIYIAYSILNNFSLGDFVNAIYPLLNTYLLFLTFNIISTFKKINILTTPYLYLSAGLVLFSMASLIQALLFLARKDILHGYEAGIANTMFGIGYLITMFAFMKIQNTSISMGKTRK
ncbi:MAG: hypothetical protein QXS91_00140 [Candidatus Anstonellales archaeon]